MAAPLPLQHRPDCPAQRHDTYWAWRRYGCRCLAAETAARDHWQRTNGRRTYIPGRHRTGRSSAEAPDRVAVLRAADGERIRLTSSELAAAIALLLREKVPQKDIALRLGCSFRTVQRHVAVARARP